MSQHSQDFRSNRGPEELWGRDSFGSSFAVSLADHMRCKDRAVNYIKLNSTGLCSIVNLDLKNVYGTHCTDSDIYYSFDTYPERYSAYADGIPDMSLVVTGNRPSCNAVFDLKTTVVPDSSTHDANSEDMGPEITLRAPTLIHCALSMYEGLRGREAEALDVIGGVCSKVGDWSDQDEISFKIQDIVDSLNRLESRFCGLQRPVMMQAIWKTRGLSPILEDDALDMFVWSDYSLTRLFLDGDRRSRGGNITRPARCAVRLAYTLYELYLGRKPDLNEIYRETSYGLGNNREMMVNGRMSNAYMRCDRLTKPSVKSSEIADIMPSGTEEIIVPERRLDQTMYYAMLGNKV